MRSRRLIWAALRSRASNDNGNVEDDAGRGDPEGNGCDGDIDPPQIARERTTKKQQSGLQHQRQRLHHRVEVPRNDPIEFALSILATFDGSPPHVGRLIPVQPLLAEHRQEGGEKRSGETRVQDGLDLNYHMGRASPLWEGRRVVSEGSVVDLVDEDAEEGGSLVTRVGLELGLDVEDECGGDSGEQTSLRPRQHVYTGVSYRTHEDEGRVQIFIVLLHELLIVFLGLPAIVLKESCPVILLSGR